MIDGAMRFTRYDGGEVFANNVSSPNFPSQSLVLSSSLHRFKRSVWIQAVWLLTIDVKASNPERNVATCYLYYLNATASALRLQCISKISSIKSLRLKDGVL